MLSQSGFATPTKTIEIRAKLQNGCDGVANPVTLWNRRVSKPSDKSAPHA